ERHGAEAGDLAHDESPAGKVSPERADHPPGVDIGATCLRETRRQLGRGGGIGEGDDCSEDEAPEETGTCHPGRRAEHGKHAGTDHGSETEDHCVEETELPGEAGTASVLVTRHVVGGTGLEPVTSRV